MFGGIAKTFEQGLQYSPSIQALQSMFGDITKTLEQFIAKTLEQGTAKGIANTLEQGATPASSASLKSLPNPLPALPTAHHQKDEPRGIYFQLGRVLSLQQIRIFNNSNSKWLKLGTTPAIYGLI